MSARYAFDAATEAHGNKLLPRAWPVLIYLCAWVLPVTLAAWLYRGTVCCPL